MVAKSEMQKLAHELGEVWEEINNVAELQARSKDVALKRQLAKQEDFLSGSMVPHLLSRIARAAIADSGDAAIAAAAAVELLNSAKETIVDNGVLGPEPEAKFAEAHALVSALFAFLVRQHDRGMLEKLGIAELADAPNAAQMATERRAQLPAMEPIHERPAALEAVGAPWHDRLGSDQSSMINVFSEIDLAWAEVNYWDQCGITARNKEDVAAAHLAERRCNEAISKARELEKAASLLPVRSDADALEALSRIEAEMRELASMQEDDTHQQMARLTVAVNEWIKQHPRLADPAGQTGLE